MSMSNMKKRMGEKERWSQGLPDDILRLIAQRLYISDYQVFRQVCPSWRAAVDRGIATQSCPPAAPHLPWLLLIDCHKFWTGNPNFLNAFYIENKYSFSFLRGPTSFSSEIPTSQYYIGSIESWLIVAVRKHDTVMNFFFNPVSRARVMLPSKSLFLVKMVASYPPAPPTSPQQNNCFVAALCNGNRLGICRPTDTSWTFIGNIHGIDYSDIEIIDQKLYVAGRSRDKYYVLEFDIVTEDDNVTRAIYNCELRFDGRILSGEKSPILAKDSASKELLILILPADGIKQGFRVYKMDGKPSCEEVTDLGGDRILFLSKKSNIVINDKTLERNCIYFASDYRYGSWVYSLTDMSFKTVNFPMDYSSPSAQTLWFTPHPW